jgi:hypothetical protein
MKKLISFMMLALVLILVACNPTEELKFENARVAVTAYTPTTNSLSFKVNLADPENELDDLVLKVVVSANGQKKESEVTVVKNQTKTVKVDGLERETEYLVEIFGKKDGVELKLYTNSGALVKTLAQGDTKEDPLEISTVDQFKEMNNKKFYVLTQDLDFQGASINPLFTSGSPFTGGFDGQGHTIKNILINDASHVNKSYLSIFGYVSKAYIKNVVFENVHIDNTSKPYSSIQYVGLIISKVSNNEFLMENVEINNSSITFQHNVATYDSGTVVPTSPQQNPTNGNRWYDVEHQKLYTYTNNAWNEGVDVPSTKPLVPMHNEMYFDVTAGRLYKASRTTNRNFYLGLVGGSVQGTINDVRVNGSSIVLYQNGINGTYSGSDVANTGTHVGGAFGLIEQDKGFNIRRISVLDTTITVNINQDIKSLGAGSLYVGGVIGAYRSDYSINEIISDALVTVNYTKHQNTVDEDRDTLYIGGLIGILAKANIGNALFHGNVDVNVSHELKKVYVGLLNGYATKSGTALVAGGTVNLSTTDGTQVGHVVTPYNYITVSSGWSPSTVVKYLAGTSLIAEGVAFDLSQYTEVLEENLDSVITSEFVLELFA